MFSKQNLLTTLNAVSNRHANTPVAKQKKLSILEKKIIGVIRVVWLKFEPVLARQNSRARAYQDLIEW